MKLTIDNMTIEGTVEECLEFKRKLEKESNFLTEEEFKKYFETIQEEMKKYTKLPITPQPIIPYKQPTYIRTPVVPYEPNKIWCGGIVTLEGVRYYMMEDGTLSPDLNY